MSWNFGFNFDSLILLVPMTRDPGIENLVAPAISPTAVISTTSPVEIVGDDGTWSAPASFTYQWQRNTGSWEDIAGATSKNYAPVDADFGYALRLSVFVGAVVAYSNATNLTIESVEQSLGSEVLTNADMDWSGGQLLPNWTLQLGTWGGDPGMHEVAPDGSAGTGACRFYGTAANAAIRANSIWTAGDYYELFVDVTALTSGVIYLSDTGFNLLGSPNISSVTQRQGIAHIAGPNVYVTAATNPDLVVNKISAKKIQRNSQLTAPSADMDLTQYFTLPVSPFWGSTVRLFARISDFDAGNFWVAEIKHDGTTWYATLYSYATFNPTVRIASVALVGDENGLKLHMNGTSISMFTTNDGGSNWTQRGSTIANSLYQTATGINAIVTSDVTPGYMVFTNPT